MPTNAIIKRKKKSVITLKLDEPDEFINDYYYFIDCAKKFLLKVYKYKSGLYWEGPAVIMSKTKASKLNFIKKIKIPLTVDIVNEDENKIAIYPKKKCSNRGIEYDYTFIEEEEPVELVEWVFNKHIFHLDKNTNIVYEPGTDIKIGKKVYKENKYTIEDLY